VKSVLLLAIATAVVNFPASGQNTTYRIGSFEVRMPSNWMVLQKDSKGVFAGRLPAPSAQLNQPTAAAWAVAGEFKTESHNPAIILEGIKDFKIQDASGGRFRPISHGFQALAFKDLSCMRFNQAAYDQDKILEIFGLVCLDKKDPRQFIDLETSTRRPPDAPAPDISVETEALFNSLRYVAP